MKYLLIILLLFVSCSRESSFSQPEVKPTSDATKLKSIHVLEKNTDAGIPFTIESKVEFQYIPNTFKFSEISLNFKTTQNGNNYFNSGKYIFTYSNDRLSNVRFWDSKMDFIYNNGKLVKIEYNNIQGWPGKNASFSLEYDSQNNLQKIICEHPYYNVVNELNYSSGKVNKVTQKRDNVVIKTYNIEYDNKYNAFRNISFEEKIFFGLLDGYGYFYLFDEYYTMGSFWGENNVISNNSTRVTYTYNKNDYPLTATLKFFNSSDANATADYSYEYY